MFVHIDICSRNFVSVILKKIYIIFIYKYWHYNLCYSYFEEDKSSLFIIICVVAKFPKDIVPVVSKAVIMSISLKFHRLSTIRDLLRIVSQNRKC